MKYLDKDGLTHLWDRLRTLLAGKQNTLTFDAAPTANSANPVTSGGVKAALDGKQNTLTFDSAPTANSANPVTSGGIRTALDERLTWQSVASATGKTAVSAGEYAEYGIYLYYAGYADFRVLPREAFAEAERLLTGDFDGLYSYGIRFAKADGQYSFRVEKFTDGSTDLSASLDMYILAR